MPAAQAQFSRLADEIENKRLDIHPRPSWRNEIGTRLYGVVDVGLVTGKDRESFDNGQPVPNPSRRLKGIGPSFLGVRSDVPLDAGWQVHLQLEHGFDADTGAPKADCQPFWDEQAEHAVKAAPARRTVRCTPFWDRRATVALAHRAYGRLDIGRLEQPARRIAFMASPWGPDTVASAGEHRLYVPRPDVRSDPGHSDQSITWQSPYEPTYRLELQARLSRLPGDPSADRPTHGGGWQITQGPWQAGIGWQRWDDGSRSLPMAVVYTVGHWKAFGGLTVGRQAERDFRNVFVGASIRQRSGARPGEFRLGLNVFEQEGRPSEIKAGAGFEFPYSRRTALQANVSAASHDPVANRVRFDVGVRHAFAL